MASSSKLSAPSLYDDDIVDVRRRHRHSSSGSREASSDSSSSTESTSSSRHHHHHHHHDSANARLQGSTDRYASTDYAIRTFYRWLIQSIIILALAAVCVVLWRRGQRLADDIAQYRGTNTVLIEQIAQKEAEQKNLLLQIENLEHDNAELEEINRALRESIVSGIGGTAQ